MILRTEAKTFSGPNDVPKTIYIILAETSDVQPKSLGQKQEKNSELTNDLKMAAVTPPTRRQFKNNFRQTRRGVRKKIQCNNTHRNFFNNIVIFSVYFS